MFLLCLTYFVPNYVQSWLSIKCVVDDWGQLELLDGNKSKFFNLMIFFSFFNGRLFLFGKLHADFRKYIHFKYWQFLLFGNKSKFFNLMIFFSFFNGRLFLFGKLHADFRKYIHFKYWQFLLFGGLAPTSWC